MSNEYNPEVISRWQYDVISENAFDVNLGQFDTYGIRLTGNNHEEFLHDVSVCKKTVVYMTDLFNQLQLLPVHFKEAVEDMIQ